MCRDTLPIDQWVEGNTHCSTSRTALVAVTVTTACSSSHRPYTRSPGCKTEFRASLAPNETLPSECGRWHQTVMPRDDFPMPRNWFLKQSHHRTYEITVEGACFPPYLLHPNGSTAPGCFEDSAPINMLRAAFAQCSCAKQFQLKSNIGILSRNVFELHQQ